MLSKNHPKVFLQKIRSVTRCYLLKFCGGIQLSDADFLSKIGRSKISGFESPSVLIGSSQIKQVAKYLTVSKPNLVSLVINEADEVCNHRFSFLGLQKAGIGKKINWRRDFKSGRVWPLEHYSRVKLVLGEGSDVKVPWELSRFQHLSVLGEAYWFTGNEKYAREFVDEIDDWIRENPVEFGVNWACTMDVAIRAVNWIVAYSFFENSKALTDDFKLKLLKNLFLHGRFIRSNLEYGFVNSNHYLSDIIGLIYLGLFFRETKEGQKWLDFGVRELIKEMDSQVHDDGVDFEGSIPYHRLVTELFLYPAILCQRNGIKLPSSFMGKLERMIEFTMHYTKPDGRAPVWGDADDGRLLKFGSQQGINDHRYLLSIGAILFNRPDFKENAGEFHEEALWVLGPEGKEKFDAIPPSGMNLTSKAFTTSGFYIMRDKNNFMLIDCGGVGTRGVGNHEHCDALSFELYSGDKSFIIDPGSYVYTASAEYRNLFRGTAYHNTILVDNAEMNRFDSKKLFRMRDDAKPKVNKWLTNSDYDFFDGQHHGYMRLKNPVTHRRQVLFSKKEGYWLINDLLTGKGEHDYVSHLHFNPMELSKVDELSIITKTEGSNLLVVPIGADNLDLTIEDGWVSPSYGIKHKAPIAKYGWRGKAPTQLTTILYPYAGKMPDTKAIREKAIGYWKKTFGSNLINPK